MAEVRAALVQSMQEHVAFAVGDARRHDNQAVSQGSLR